VILKNIFKSNEAVDTFFEEGKNAFWNDVAATDNPYKHSDNERTQQWDLGWNNAQRTNESLNKNLGEAQSKVLDFLDKAFMWAVNAAGILIILAGIALFGFQVFVYLKEGKWVEFPLSFLAQFGPNEFVSWLNHPTSWYGIHKIIHGTLELIPLSLFAIFVGGYISSMAYEAEVKNA